MNCSSLNEHLFSRNLVDSPNCVCGRSESISHFLLHCDRYRELRNETLFSLNLPVMLNTDILLFGSDQMTDDQNKQVFIKVQKFILKSKRFINWLATWLISFSSELNSSPFPFPQFVNSLNYVIKSMKSLYYIFVNIAGDGFVKALRLVSRSCQI